MIEIYAVNIMPRIEISEFQKLLLYLAPEKQEKVKRFIKWEDAQRALIADILVRTVICGRLNVKNRELSFDKNAYGKPFIKNCPDFHFNISHSGEWVVCAVDSAPVGIDIEMIKPIDFDIAERFFSREECKDLMTRSKSERLSYFYNLWTLKESYIKWIGKGLSIPLDSFTIKVCDGGIGVKAESEPENCFFMQYDISSGYKLSVCAGSEKFPDNVIIKSCGRIFEEILTY